MQTPEEFAREFFVRFCPAPEPCHYCLDDSRDLADLIRARDAEVAAQARAEFEDMEHRLSVLLCNLTGGLLSKTGYDVATMEQHIEDYFEREVVEPARAEARAEVLAGFTEEWTVAASDWIEAPRDDRTREAAERLLRTTPQPAWLARRLGGPWGPEP